MSQRLHSIFSRPLAPWVVASATLALSACGGGGGTSTGTSTGANTGTTGTGSGTGTDTTVTSTPTPDLVLSGVAAVGAPLGAAQVSVVDAKGKALGSTTTRLVDGYYTLTLNSKTVTAPLMLQARGVDAAGNPQVLHSAVMTTATAMVANITPLTDAAVAMALGADPKPVFAGAADNATPLASLSQAKAAADFLKTLIKTPLADLKVTDSAKLDLLGDAGFAANKGSQDLLIESLRIGLGKGNKGEAQLQLASKLLINMAPEVLVDLAVAKTELAKTTGAAPATSVTSALKVTTGFASVLPNLGQLDDLGAAINKMIAQGTDAAGAAASPLLAGYMRHNGRQPADLAELFGNYAAKNWQLGRFLVTGCADDKAVTGNCIRVQVAALVTDSSGAVTDLFSDVVSYNKAATAGTPTWGLVGNGKKIEFSVRGASWLAREADGTVTAATASSTNPSAGVQLLLRGQDKLGAVLLPSATVQTPSGFSIAMAACAQPYLCLSATAGATSVEATGALGDTLLQPASVGWVGGADAQRNAKYQASYTLDGAGETRVAWLGGDLAAIGSTPARFPALDGVAAATPLTRAAMNAGLNLNWASWAAANPDLRLSRLQAVIRQPGQLSVREVPVLPGLARLGVPAMVADTGSAPLAHELWLTAEDSLGRRLVTRYTLLP